MLLSKSACFAIGDFDCNYSPWKNENRRKRVNALLTEKRDSMYIDGHGRVERYLKVAIWRACRGQEINPHSTKLQIAGTLLGLKSIGNTWLLIIQPLVVCCPRASEFANVNQSWDLKARCISCVFTRTLPCQAVCRSNPALTDG